MIYLISISCTPIDFFWSSSDFAFEIQLFWYTERTRNSQNATTIIQIKTNRWHLHIHESKSKPKDENNIIFTEENLKERKYVAQRRAHENKENNAGLVWMIEVININWGLVLNSSRCMHRDVSFCFFMLKWSIAFCILGWVVRHAWGLGWWELVEEGTSPSLSRKPKNPMLLGH